MSFKLRPPKRLAPACG